MNKLVKRNTLIVGDVFRPTTRPGEVNLVVEKNLERLVLLRTTDGEPEVHAAGPHRFWAEADWPGEVERLGNLPIVWDYRPSVDQLREVLSPFQTPYEAATEKNEPPSDLVPLSEMQPGDVFLDEGEALEARVSLMCVPAPPTFRGAQVMGFFAPTADRPADCVLFLSNRAFRGRVIARLGIEPSNHSAAYLKDVLADIYDLLLSGVDLSYTLEEGASYLNPLHSAVVQDRAVKELRGETSSDQFKQMAEQLVDVLLPEVVAGYAEGFKEHVRRGGTGREKISVRIYDVLCEQELAAVRADERLIDRVMSDTELKLKELGYPASGSEPDVQEGAFRFWFSESDD